MLINHIPDLVVIGEDFQSIIKLQIDRDVLNRFKDVPEAERLKAGGRVGSMLDWRLRKPPQNDYYIRSLTEAAYMSISGTKEFNAALNQENATLVWTFFRSKRWAKSKPQYASMGIGITNTLLDDFGSDDTQSTIKYMIEATREEYMANAYHSSSLVQVWLDGISFASDSPRLN